MIEKDLIIGRENENDKRPEQFMEMIDSGFIAIVRRTYEVNEKPGKILRKSEIIAYVRNEVILNVMRNHMDFSTIIVASGYSEVIAVKKEAGSGYIARI
jgi:hypothetical protein